MPVFNTPAGQVDAPSQDAANLWASKKGGAGAPPSGGSAPAPAGASSGQNLSQTGGDTQEQPSALGALFRGFLHGMGDPVYGGAQIGARSSPAMGMEGPMPDPRSPQQQQQQVQQVDAAAQRREQAYQANPGTVAHPFMSGLGRVGGNVAATAPLAIAPGSAVSIPARLAAGAATGAAGAMMRPVTSASPTLSSLVTGEPGKISEGDYWSQKAQQVGIGAGVGAAVGGVGGMIGPPLSAAAQDVVSKFPHVASIVRGTAIRSPDNFNRAVVNQALDPIGVQVPKNLKAGHGLIEFAYDRLTDTYNKVLPKTSMMADPEFTAEIDALKTAAKTIPPAQEKQFNSIVGSWLDTPLKDGVLDGKQFNKTISQLGTKINNYVGSSDGGQKELADHLIGVRESMLDALERQNPDVATELKNLRSSYAMYARIRSAANRRTDSQGIFTPEDLTASIRTGDKSGGKQQWATGGAMMQTMAEATRGPMSGPKVNKLLTTILGGAAGAHIGGTLGGGVGAAIGASVGPDIVRAGIRATQNPAARVVGRGVSGAAPAAGAFSAKISDRMKAARKVGELKSQVHSANRRGDLKELQSLNSQLAEAIADYRKLRPSA